MDEVLEIEGREIRSRRLADDVVWFDFAELCEGPRSQNDYIELARVYHAVLIKRRAASSLRVLKHGTPLTPGPNAV